MAVLEDFRRLEMMRYGRKYTSHARWRQDKGHRGEWQAFADSLRSAGLAPIPFQSIVSTTLTTLGIVKSRATGQPVTIDTQEFLRRVSLQKDPEN